MTLIQLEYLVALDRHRHFGKAAQSCFISQPSLSMQIRKLEEELKVDLFIRLQNPVQPTEIGIRIIEQAKKVLAEEGRIKEIVADERKDNVGHLKLGVIPTLAPYLLPLFLDSFIKENPRVKISISELTTEKILRSLRTGVIDAGILATPVNGENLKEDILFYEEFVAYVSRKEQLYKKKYLLPGDIDVNKLWLLEEGHCLRSQAINLCNLQKNAAMEKHFEYESGSIETLKRFVEKNQGITLLPELATIDLSQSKKQMLRYFKSPAPAREISIVSEKSFIKTRLIEILKHSIITHLPREVGTKRSRKIIGIEP